MTPRGHRHFERTDLLLGIEKNANAITDFINNSNHSYNAYTDSKGPALVIKIKRIRESYIEFVKRGGHIRFITEITRENVDYCKEIMKLAELRHIEGIKGIVRINEKGYQSNLAVQESKLASILFHSTLKEVIQTQQNLYDNLWKTAVPAERRIKELEIEEGAENSKSKKSCQTLQLWTNPNQDQYAIKFEGKSELLAATDQKMKYTDVVETSDYIEDLEYDWDYTLKHWISSTAHSQSPSSSSTDRTLVTKLIANNEKSENGKRISSRLSGSEM